MPPTLTGDAAKSFQVAPEMEVVGAASGQDKRSSRNVTNSQTVARERGGAQKPVDKQSLDYVLRSGLAGGLAGCAVSYKNPLSRIINVEVSQKISKANRI